LTEIPPAPRGVPQVEVTFDIDANGILNVTAKDKSTGRDQSVTISNSSGVSEDEIQKMVEDAKKHEAEDKLKRAKVESKNKLSGLIFQAGGSVVAIKEKELDVPQLSEMESEIEKAKSALESEDVAAMDAAYETLTVKYQEAMQVMYAQVAEKMSETMDDDDDDKDFTDEDVEDIIDAEVVDA